MGFFENSIFSHFGVYHKLADSNVDGNGKGFLERYNEAIGNDADVLLEMTENLVKKLHNPTFLDSPYISIAEEDLGIDLFLGSDTDLRKKLLARIMKYYQIRGSKKCYDHLFKLVGFNSVEVEVFDVYGFDGLDENYFDNGVWDTAKGCCVEYDVKLVGSVHITNEVCKAIQSIIEFNEPINAKLRDVYINNSIIVLGDAIFECSDYTLNSPESNADLVFSQKVKNNGNGFGVCSVKLTFDTILENGASPLNSALTYHTEDGLFGEYSLVVYNLVHLKDNASTVIVLIEEAPTLTVEYKIVLDGVIHRQGTLGFTVLLGEVTVVDTPIFDDSSTAGIEFTSDIVNGNIRLVVSVASMGLEWKLQYKFQ